MANFPDSSIANTSGFNASVAAAIQDRTLQRVFRDTLYPRILFRAEAPAELWPVNLGGNQTFTRTGPIQPTTRPLVAGGDPTPSTYQLEQWEATAQQWGGTIDTHMPTSYVTLASQYLRNMHQLGLHAGQSMNRVVRDKLYNAYTAGNTVVKAGGISAGTSVPVANLNGFTRKIKDGRPQLVSAQNPLQITITGVTGTRDVVGFTSDIAGDEIHGGTLTLSATTGVVLAGREAVLAVNRSRLVYSGGGTRIDDITNASQFAMKDVRSAVAQLRYDCVPTHEDGFYHSHLDPISENQIFNDNEWQRLNQSLPAGIHYAKFAVANILGVTFYRNTETPNVATVVEDPQRGFTTGFELVNPAGIPIHRPIFTGHACIEEKYLDESKYISDAGIQGKIGEFAITNGGVQVMCERIRLILRAPLDRLQQQTTTSWSFSGDWPVPTDSTFPSSPAAFKRAVVVVHGE